MKLTVIGSGVLIPQIGRGNSGYFLKTEHHSILIDGGSGTLRKFPEFNLDYRNIDTICYSHLHPDHTMDLIPLLFAFKNDPNVKTQGRPLQIIGPKGFQSFFDRMMDIFGQWVLPDDLEIKIKEVTREKIALTDVNIMCSRTIHTDHSVTFRFDDGAGNDIFYSGDTTLCEELIESARGVKTLILECSAPDEMKQENHLTPTECGKIAAETNSKKLVLTHFYPEVLKTDILGTVSKYYKGNIEMAYDGMVIDV
jgi:ribonuclease BN (tRNA processing enzyme)